MINKISFLILALLALTFEKPEDSYIPTYGKITIYDGNMAYLDIQNFLQGNKLYLKISFNNGYLYKEVPMFVKESDIYSVSSFSDFRNIYSTSYKTVRYTQTFYKTVTLKSAAKYLLIYNPECQNGVTSVTIEHTKENESENKMPVWAIVLIIIFIIAFIGLCIFVLIRRCSRAPIFIK